MPNTHETLTSLFVDIADAIRAKTGGTEDIVADDFPDAIGDIETGITPTGKISITENANNIDVSQYAFADVNVSSGLGGSYDISSEVDGETQTLHIVDAEGPIETFYATNGSYAFYTRIMNYPSRLPNLEYCTYLEEVHAPNSTANIAVNQFNRCTNLKIIDVPKATNIAGVSAFGDCKALKQVAFPKVTTWYNNNVFVGCTALERVQLGSVGNPINAAGSSNYRVFNGCTQSGLTITLYVADDAVIPFNYQPWGATKATIVYRSATTGEVLTP